MGLLTTVIKIQSQIHLLCHLPIVAKQERFYLIHEESNTLTSTVVKTVLFQKCSQLIFIILLGRIIISHLDKVQKC